MGGGLNMDYRKKKKKVCSLLENVRQPVCG